MDGKAATNAKAAVDWLAKECRVLSLVITPNPNEMTLDLNLSYRDGANALCGQP